MAAHTCSHTHTHDALTPHRIPHSAQPTDNMLKYMCTHQLTNKPYPHINQLASQQAKFSSPQTNYSTFNEATQKTYSQANQQAKSHAHRGGGCSITWEEGGTKHTTA